MKRHLINKNIIIQIESLCWKLGTLEVSKTAGWPYLYYPYGAVLCANHGIIRPGITNIYSGFSDTT